MVFRGRAAKFWLQWIAFSLVPCRNFRGARLLDLVRGNAGMTEGTMLSDVANWIAPAATILAAMMTAANLGARITGWGFVVFTLASLCWIVVGLEGREPGLVIANGALMAINMVGIWRWLGLQSAREDGAGAAERASRRAASPTLFTATGLAGMPAFSADGEELGTAAEALVECHSGTISYVVIASTGEWLIDETLRAVPREAITFQPDRLVLALSLEEFCTLLPLAKDDWPAAVQGTLRGTHR
jgi:hypothetical protein